MPQLLLSVARWKPNRDHQRDYLCLCTFICALGLLSDNKTHDAGFRDWLQGQHGLLSNAVADPFPISKAGDKERKKPFWPVAQVASGMQGAKWPHLPNLVVQVQTLELLPELPPELQVR